MLSLGCCKKRGAAVKSFFLNFWRRVEGAYPESFISNLLFLFSFPIRNETNPRAIKPILASLSNIGAHMTDVVVSFGLWFDVSVLCPFH